MDQDVERGARNEPELPRVAVIGAGTLGWQIAAMTAASGRRVTLFDRDPAAPARALERLRQTLTPVIANGELEWNLDEVIRRIDIGADLASSVAAVDLVIEAVREDLDTKRELFVVLSDLAPTAILATNSSSLPSALLVDVVARPERLLNLHFFDIFWRRAMVELMSCGATSDDVLATMDRFGRSLDLLTATVLGQSKGFIIN
ncbi:MAG: 3-hydroxyacyl-CoA dehydrogenase NAD-binding domain-containing protein, partial [Chloroflexota bacterium]|nr:3-hydroxyacyl-CoA dehydrogenase NAD-binding domain-containing protein [Chloroflexota bacterium]